MKAIIFFVGPAGTGKSTLTGSLLGYMEDTNRDVAVVNLDPGADELPYEADLDIREEITLEKMMKEYGLGPNGAQIAAADAVALHAGEIRKTLEGMNPDYVLVDTPGQMELFAFRVSGRVIVDTVGGKESFILFLADPNLLRTPLDFVSTLFLASSVHFRFPYPMLMVASKADLLDEDAEERVLRWSSDPEALHADLLGEGPSMAKELGIGMLRTLGELLLPGQMVPVSSVSGRGLDKILEHVDQVMGILD